MGQPRPIRAKLAWVGISRMWTGCGQHRADFQQRWGKLDRIRAHPEGIARAWPTSDRRPATFRPSPAEFGLMRLHSTEFGPKRVKLGMTSATFGRNVAEGGPAESGSICNGSGQIFALARTRPMCGDRGQFSTNIGRCRHVQHAPPGGGTIFTCTTTLRVMRSASQDTGWDTTGRQADHRDTGGSETPPGQQKWGRGKRTLSRVIRRSSAGRPSKLMADAVDAAARTQRERSSLL